MLNLKKNKTNPKKVTKPGYIQLILVQFRIELLQTTIKPFRAQYNIKSPLYLCLITFFTLLFSLWLSAKVTESH